MIAIDKLFGFRAFAADGESLCLDYGLRVPEIVVQFLSAQCQKKLQLANEPITAISAS
jgi:hypothetical protein